MKKININVEKLALAFFDKNKDSILEMIEDRIEKFIDESIIEKWRWQKNSDIDANKSFDNFNKTFEIEFLKNATIERCQVSGDLEIQLNLYPENFEIEKDQ